MLKIIKIFSRPLSPHLTIYSGQFTSMFSIWHRITGVSLVMFLVFSLLILKFFAFNAFNFSLYFFSEVIKPWLINAIFLNLNIFFIYHLLNGIKHITWDLGYSLPLTTIQTSTKVIIIIIFIVIIITIHRIMN